MLKGEMYLQAHAHRADDIITAIRISEELNIHKLVIEHGTEAHLIVDYLKEKNTPVAYGPMLTPRIKMELRKRHYDSVPKLIEGGIKVALITDHPYNSIDQLRIIAIMAHSQGVNPMDSMKCITLNAAALMGLDNRIEKLCEGYDAVLVVLDKSALDIMAKVKLTMVNGAIVYRSDV